jgi:hypothetical protein
MMMTVRARDRGGWLVGCIAAVDHHVALGGGYGVGGDREGAIGVEVPAVATAATWRTTLLTEPHRLK